MTTIDVAAARAATPGCAGVAFLNNAGAALPTQRTLDAVVDHLRLEAAIGGYLANDAAAERVAAGRQHAADLLNANGPDEIALVPSDSAGFVKVFWGLVLGGRIGRGQRILVDRISYNSHYLAFLQARDAFDLRLDVLPSHADGSLDIEACGAALDGGDVALVNATMIGTHCGLVNPVAALGAICRQRGILYLVDACQALGQLPVDVQAIGADVVTATGRKWLRAPRGTGLLWVRRDVIGACVPPGIDGSSAEWIDEATYTLPPHAGRFEEFETSMAARVGFVAALEQVGELGIDSIHQRVSSLAEGLRHELAGRPRLTVLDGDGERSGIVTFRADGIEAAAVVATAADRGITINMSSAPWAQLDMRAKGLTTVVRASPHYYNTDDELDRLLAAVDAELQR